MNNYNDITEYASRKLRDEGGKFSIWGKSLLDNYQRVSKIAFIPPISLERKRDFILLGVRGFSRLAINTRKKCHLVLRARDIGRLHRIPSSFTYDLASYKQAYLGIINQDKKYLIDLESKISKTFDLVSPKILMANSTIDPIDRMWIKEATKRGVRTLCLQHGLYAHISPSYTLEEDIVNKYIAFDEVQAKIVSRNIPADKISYLGVRSAFKWVPNNKKLNICLVGEDFECYGLENIKKLIIDNYLGLVKDLSINQNLNFFYKPHPSEINCYGITNSIKKISTVEGIDVFIGFTSTLLKDVASRKKLAIQILASSINADIFESNGYCLSLSNDSDLFKKINNILMNGVEMPYIANSPLEKFLC